MRPRLVVVGAVEVARSLVRLARELGFETVVIDGRATFATPERFPDVDRLIVGWPDEVADEIGLGPNDAVAVLTHDVKFDEPAIVEALRRGCRYVGAVGSKKTQADRRARLLEAGVTEADLARLRGPVGLDLGGRAPAETALAILAEIVAERYGGSGVPLRAARGRPDPRGWRACRRARARGRGRVAVRRRQAPGVASAAGRSSSTSSTGSPTAGIADVVVVLGDDADAVEAAIEWGSARRVRNPDPSRGLSSSLAGRDRRRSSRGASTAVLDRRSATSRSLPVEAVARPRRRAAGRRPPDRRPGLPRRPRPQPGPARSGRLRPRRRGDRRPRARAGPRGASRTSSARSRSPGENPDVDTRADLVRAARGALGHAGPREPRAGRPASARSPTAPTSTPRSPASSGPIPTRTDEPALEVLRVARPAGRDVARHRRRCRPLRAADRGGPRRRAAARSSPSTPSRRHARGAARDRRRLRRSRTCASIEGRWPPRGSAARSEADVSLIAHVGYDIEEIGAFLGAMEAATRRLVRRGPDGAPAVVDRRRLLAARPRRGAGRRCRPCRTSSSCSRRWAATPEVRPARARAAPVRRPRRARGVPPAPALDRAGRGEGRDLPSRARRAGRDRRRRAGSVCATRRRCRSASSPGRRSRPMIEESVAPDGRPTVQPLTRADWRAWLEERHATSTGVWLVGISPSHRQAAARVRGRRRRAALRRAGSIRPAATSMTERTRLWVCPRRPRSVWSRSNRARVERLTAAGLMLPPGWRRRRREAARHVDGPRRRRGPVRPRRPRGGASRRTRRRARRGIASPRRRVG